MKKRIAVVLMAVLVLSMLLCACGDDNAALVGTWEYTMDMAPYLNEGIEEGAEGDELLVEHLTLDTIEIIVVAEFTEDDECFMYVPEESAEAATEELLTQYKAGLRDYFEALLLAEGVQLSDEYTVDDAMKDVNLDLDAIVAEAFPQEALDSMFDSFDTEGKFSAKDGKLYISAGLDYDIDINVYETYTIEGDVLTIDEGKGGDDDGDSSDIYPMTFVKAD